MENIGPHWLNICSSLVIHNLSANLNFITLYKLCQEPACHFWCLQGYWGFLTRDMEDMGYAWHNTFSSYVIHKLSVKFQLNIIIVSVSRSPLSSSVTWMMLLIPERRHEGRDILEIIIFWHNTMSISWKFCVNIFIFIQGYHGNKNMTHR